MKLRSGPLFSAVLCLLPALVFGQDRVYNLKNVPVPGTVTEMSADKIIIDTPNGARSFEVNEVTRVSFGEEPRELVKVREFVRELNFESALSEVKSIDLGSVSREIIKQEIQYYRAMCDGKIAMATGGKRDEAITNLQNFLKANSGSFHFYEGAELLGDLATAAGDYAQAGRFYAAIGKAPWSDYKMRSNVLEAKALVAQSKFSEALEKYEFVIGSSESSPDANRQKSLATVGKAVCLSNTAKVEDATKLLEDLIKNNDSKDARLFGRAYNALGGCYLLSNRPKEALLQYLHVHYLFYGEAETHAEALQHLVKLWTDLQKSERAIESRTLLQQSYGGSVWAKGI